MLFRNSVHWNRDLVIGFFPGLGPKQDHVHLELVIAMVMNEGRQNIKRLWNDMIIEFTRIKE